MHVGRYTSGTGKTRRWQELIDVEVLVLPKGIRRKGRVNENLSFDRIKRDIVEKLGLGDAADYDLAILPHNPRQTISSFKLMADDTIVLTERNEMGGAGFELRQ